MKVFSKILGAILLLGCLAYISFVFGKYVLSSTLLKSIPQSERIISTKAPVSSTLPTSQSIQAEGTPRVQIEVMPSSRPIRKSSSSSSNADDDTDSSESDRSMTDSKIKNLDEGVTPTKHRRKRRTKKEKSSDNAPEKSSPAPKPSSKAAPIRRLYQSEKPEDKSPVPQPEKSTSATSPKSTSKPSSGSSEPTAKSGDAGSISPVPKPG